MDILGGFIFSPPLSEKEKNYFDCYFQSTHCERNDFLLNLYGCSYNKALYEKENKYQFDKSEEKFLDCNTLALEHLTNQNPWVISGKKLVLTEYNKKKSISYHDLVICANELLLIIHHFFNLDPICKKINPEYFSFLEKRELQGKIYIKLDEIASLFVMEIINNKVKLCELNYTYKLPLTNSNKEENIVLNGKLLEYIKFTTSLPSNFLSRLEKQYHDINIVDIKNNSLIEEDNCSLFEYSPCSEIIRSLNYMELNKKIIKKEYQKIVKI